MAHHRFGKNTNQFQSQSDINAIDTYLNNNKNYVFKYDCISFINKFNKLKKVLLNKKIYAYYL